MLIKRLKHLALTLLIVLSGGLAVAPLTASAASFKGDACAAVNVLNNSKSTTCSSNGESALSRILKLVLNVLSFLVGITAIIMIIIGGFKFITSNGDSNNISAARNTILYAVIGLIIVAAAQVMVHFVLASSNAAINNCKTAACTSHNK